MMDFFHNLATGKSAEQPVIKPRLATRFEAGELSLLTESSPEALDTVTILSAGATRPRTVDRERSLEANGDEIVAPREQMPWKRDESEARQRSTFATAPALQPQPGDPGQRSSEPDWETIRPSIPRRISVNLVKTDDETPSVVAEDSSAFPQAEHQTSERLQPMSHQPLGREVRLQPQIVPEVGEVDLEAEDPLATNSAIRPAPSAQRREQPTKEESSPTIEITIGRIELRSAQPPTPSSPTQRASYQPPLSLSNYLKRRNGEQGE